MPTLAYTDELVVVSCWCGINLAIPGTLDRHRKRKHENGEREVDVYCPVGHIFVPSGEPRVRKVERERDEAEERRARASARADQAEASARGHKAAATRARKRSAAAVCPCCHRSFKQLRRHMKSKHPDYDPEAG